MSRRTFRLVVSALALSAAAAATTAAVGLGLEEGHDAIVPVAALGVLTGVLLVVAAQRMSFPRRVRPGLHTNDVVFDAFPEPALIVENGRIAAVNNRLCALLGQQHEALVGATMPFPFWPPEHRHELERWHKQLEKLGTAEAELTLRRSDGQRVPVLAAGNGLPAAPGATPSYVVSVRDITERRRVEDRLAALASRDPLTELLNEWGFQERLSEEVGRARATGRALSVVLVQFDGLATQGDLAAAIQRFRADLRAGEQISRTNESELAWILPEIDAAGAIAAVSRALGHVSRVEGDRLRSVRVSAGICELGADHDAAVLYAFANRALRAARGQGGGTVVYSPDVTLVH